MQYIHRLASIIIADCYPLAILLRSRIEVATCCDAPQKEEVRQPTSLHERLDRSVLELVDTIPGLIATSVGPRPLIQLQALDGGSPLFRLTLGMEERV